MPTSAPDDLTPDDLVPATTRAQAELRLRYFDNARAGTGPLMGAEVPTVYRAAADWLDEIARQLGPEDDRPPYWSPNLLFASPYAQVTAFMHGLGSATAPVIMMTAAFTLGDLYGPNADDPPGFERTPEVSPEMLTDPATPRASIGFMLQQAAASMRYRASKLDLQPPFGTQDVPK